MKITPLGKLIMVLLDSAGRTTWATGTIDTHGNFSATTASNRGITGSILLPARTISLSFASIGESAIALTGSLERNASRDRLSNVSTRARATSLETETMTAGFVISGTRPLPVLLRAVGSTLREFGVTETTTASPVLNLFRDGSRLIATSTRTIAQADSASITFATQRVGAFPLAANGSDAAMLAILDPGAYTAAIANGGGLALIEVYDASENTEAGASRLVNLATRAYAGRDGGTLIAGFVLRGLQPKRVLIRAVGPGLATFGIVAPLKDPMLELFAGTMLRAGNDNWGESGNGAAIVAAGRAAGAFALGEASKDAALLLDLEPGAYTVQVTGVGGRFDNVGVALIEIYEVP